MSRKTDLEIFNLINEGGWVWKDYEGWATINNDGHESFVPRYTVSVNDAFSFARHFFPNCRIDLTIRYDASSYACIWSEHGNVAVTGLGNWAETLCQCVFKARERRKEATK